jgi:hypothetical protein
MKHIIWVLFFFVSIVTIDAQTAIPRTSILETSEVGNSEIPTPPIVELPYINNNEEYERLISECPDCGNIIGKHIPFDISPQNSGIWTTLLSGKRIWQLRVKSETAEGLRFICDKFKLNKSTYLYFKDNHTGIIYGAYSSFNNQEVTNDFATNFFKTNDITIIIEVDNADGEIFPEIHFNKISHGLGTTDFGNAAPCNNDVNCSPWVTEWCHEIRATVQLILTKDGGDERCTGVLLNNTKNDFTPYILSSRHCYYSADLSTSLVIYNFQSPTCNPQQNGNDLLTTLGLEFLYESEGGITQNLCHQSDDAILFKALNGTFPSPIPWNYNVFYAGWNSLKVNSGSSVTCIHHPKGDVKKFSEGELKANTGNCWRVDFTNGIVEPGSSGSPLFGTDHRVIGNLSRGNVSPSELNCEDDFIARYGKLQKYFDDIDGWLAPNSPNTVAIDGIDPIGSCQDNLLLYGNFFPAHDWQLENSITIQAQNTIIAAPNGLETVITASFPLYTNLNNTSDYTFRAGQSVSLKNGFRVEHGNVFKAKIGECEAFEGCGFNYQERISPINTEAEAENIIVIDKSNQTNTGESNSSKIYPNPTTNEITIESSKSYHLNIFNMMGQQVGQENGKAKTVQYDMTKFEVGIYIFQFRFEDGTMETIRVIKQ